MTNAYPDKVVVMMSGGIDSTAVAYLLRKQCENLRGIALNYGQLDFDRARQSINRTSVDLNMPIEIVDIRNLAGIFAGFIEGDYAGYPLLLTELSRKSSASTMMCAVYAETIGYHALAEGVNKDDLKRYVHRLKVHEHVAAVQSLGNEVPFRVITPFVEMTKVQVLHQAVKLGVPLEKTWSCWTGNVRHCGACPGCQARRLAFEKAGIEDTIIYAEKPPIAAAALGGHKPEVNRNVLRTPKKT